MTQAIESVEGVRRAEVSFEDGRAEVQADRCDASELRAITGAVAAAGFGATVTTVTPLP